MPGLVTRLTLRHRREDQRGVAALLVAITMVALLVSSAMVLDFGLVRIDRQVDRSAADAATMAGLAGLKSGSGKSTPYQGVCAALRTLRTNDPRFAGVSSASPTSVWTDGNGYGVSAGCSDPVLLAKPCKPGDKTTWVDFKWTGSYQGKPLVAEIQGGYQLPTAVAPSSWREDNTTAALADADDTAQGCDQLAVTITQTRKPGLGSLATPNDLVTAVRTVGRVKLGPGGYAPAMLLLKRTGCTSLEVGSTAGSSWVKVYGSVTPAGVSQPGTIHADSDGQSCSSSVYYGKAANGIIAYAAPLPPPALGADPTKPGEITSVAGMSGLATAYDGITKVYGSSQLSGTGSARAPSGRDLVTRKPVDDRYLAGVSAAVSGAQSSVFASGLNYSNATSAPYNYTAKYQCPSSGPDKGRITALPALDASSSLYVDCAQVLGSNVSIDAGTVVFSGSIAPANSQTINLPNAHHVYVFGVSGNAIDLTSSGATFRVHTVNVDPVTTKCKDAAPVPPATSTKAALFIRNGAINESTGGSLQLCNTTVFMMGGRSDACLPAPYTDIASAPTPTQSPCAGVNGDMGNGQIKQTGGDVDWTGPNLLSDTIDADGNPTPAALAGWSDPNGPEDLALWDESAGNSTSTKYQFTGGGGFHLQGIFMVPNADPISLSGSANFDLTNAQFVATSLALASNNTTLSMRVDPNSAVTLPKLKTVGLVR